MTSNTTQAESAKHGVRSRAMSCNELGFANLTAEATPVVVFVAASTGDGDPPDNAAKFYVDLRHGASAAQTLGSSCSTPAQL